MILDRVQPGDKAPDEINVIIEISAGKDPVKYEIDKPTGAMFVDRFLGTAMFYPCNYGYVPQTLSLDGDPVDVMVIAPLPVQAGAVIKCRPLGVLDMEDDGGVDMKILAVPVTKLTPLYKDMKDYTICQKKPWHVWFTSLSTIKILKKVNGSRWVAGKALMMPRRKS